MSDPYLEALERFRESVDRLKLELAKDARVTEGRVSVLETLPREIGELRRELREYKDVAVTREDLQNAIAFAMTEHKLQESESDKKLKPAGETKVFKSKEKLGKMQMWASIVGSIVILASAYLSYHTATEVARIKAQKESK